MAAEKWPYEEDEKEAARRRTPSRAPVLGVSNGSYAASRAVSPLKRSRFQALFVDVERLIELLGWRRLLTRGDANVSVLVDAVVYPLPWVENNWGMYEDELLERTERILFAMRELLVRFMGLQRKDARLRDGFFNTRACGADVQQDAATALCWLLALFRLALEFEEDRTDLGWWFGDTHRRLAAWHAKGARKGLGLWPQDTRIGYAVDVHVLHLCLTPAFSHIVL